MAVRPRKRTRSKRPRVRPGQQPYDPLASGFRNQGQFNAAVRNRAQSQIDPLLADVNSQSRIEQRRNIGRTADIGRWAGFQTQAAQQGQAGLNTALQGVLNSTGNFSQGGNDALAAALRQQQGTEDQAAQQLGVTAPQQGADVNAALAAYRGADNNSLAGSVAGLMGTAASQVGTSGIVGREAADAERARDAGVTDELTSQRREIKGRLPSLLEAARGQISEEEQTKQAQRFQQRLANKQFGLDVSKFRVDKQNTKFQQNLANRTLGETTRSNKAGERIQGGQLHISQEQVDNETARIIQDGQIAGTKEAADQAQVKAKAFQNGVTALQKFLEPSKYERNKQGTIRTRGGHAYRRSFGDALDTLVSQVGLDVNTALRVLKTAKKFRREANNRLQARLHPKVEIPPNKV